MIDIVEHFLNHRTLSELRRVFPWLITWYRKSIVVTCGRIKLPPSKTIYIARRRGWRIVSALCRSEADLVGDRPVILFYGGSHPFLQKPVYLPFSRDADQLFRDSCRTPRVGAIGPRSYNNYHTRNKVFIVGQRSFVSPDCGGSAPSDSYRHVSSSLFSVGCEDHEIEFDQSATPKDFTREYRGFL